MKKNDKVPKNRHIKGKHVALSALAISTVLMFALLFSGNTFVADSAAIASVDGQGGNSDDGISFRLAEEGAEGGGSALPGTAGAGGDTLVFTVMFVDWDGDTLSKQTIDAGQSAMAPGAPSREGFAFTGWDGDFSDIQADVTVRALYERLESFVVTVQYLLPGAVTAAQPYTAELPKGEALETTIPHPAIDGFVPQPEADYVQADTETYTQASLAIDISSISANHTYTVTYLPDNAVQYKVVYHLPGLPPDGGCTAVTREYAGQTGATITAPAETFEGFSPPALLPEAVLAADGSTVIDVNYTRNQVTLYFNSDGGSYVEPFSGLFGSPVTPPADPQKQGSAFRAWDRDLPSVMPGEDQIYTALWDEPDTANYTVKYWLENPNDDGYSFLYGEVREGKVGAGYGTSTDDLRLAAFDDFWAPPSYYPQMPNAIIYKSFYNKNVAMIAAENEGVAITTDGAAVFNVYHTRHVTKFIFELDYEGGHSYYVTHNGERFYGEEYSISIKFGADVTALWPSVPASDNPEDNLNFRGYASSANMNVLMPVLPRSDIPALVICAGSGSNMYPWQTVRLRLRTTTAAMVNYYVDAYFEPIGGAADQSGYVPGAQQQFYVPTGSMLTMSPIAGFGAPTPQNLYPGSGELKCYYSRLQYSIHFYSGGRNIKTEKDIWYQQLLAAYDYAPASPPAGMPGYTFGGWYTSSLLLEETRFDFAGGHTMPAGDLTLYAKWNKPVFTVSYAPLNDEATIRQQYEYGETPSFPPKPQRSGYRFAGWREFGKDYLYLESNPVVRDLELVAVWQPVSGASYTVRYINKTDDQPLEPEAFITGRQAGSTATETAREIDGFLPDYVSKSLVLGQGAGEDEIVFYYIPFNSVDYNIRYESTGGDALLNTVTKSTGNTIVTENFARVPGYYPVQTQIKLQLSANAGENVILFQYAKSGDVSYSVEHHFQNLNGIGYDLSTDGVETLSAPAGSRITASARAVAGFALNAQASDGAKTINSNGNTVIRLYYDRNQYTVSFQAGPGGTLNGVTNFGRIRHGTQFRHAVAVPAPQAAAGYTFAGWSPALPENTAQVTGNRIYTAQFRALDTGVPESSASSVLPPSASSAPGTSGAGGPSAPPESGSSPTASSAPGGSSTALPVPPGGTTSSGSGAGGSGGGLPPPADAYEEIRRETLEQIIEDGGPTVTIGGQEVPLFGLGHKSVWALLNLILAVAGAVIAILLLPGAFRKRKANPDETGEADPKASAAKTGEAGETEEEAEEDAKENRKLIWRIVAVAAGLAGVITFLVTEDMRNLMVILVDNWTPLMVLLFIPVVVSAVIVARKKKPEEPEPEAGAET